MRENQERQVYNISLILLFKLKTEVDSYGSN